jgi:hypothetical protein
MRKEAVGNDVGLESVTDEVIVALLPEVLVRLIIDPVLETPRELGALVFNSLAS